MRLQLAGFTSLLAGCSFIYNPDHIKGQEDARGPDAEVITDVDPTMLKIDYAYPLVVEEGAGQGGARNALIVLHGAQILPSATVTVTPTSGPPSLIDVKKTTIAGDANWIAIELAVPVDPTRDETGANATADIPLSITVDNGNGTTVMVANPPAIHFYDQLTTPITAPVAAGKKYSKIDVTAAMPFAANGTTGRVELHAVSSASFMGAITMTASTTKPGPGGCGGSPGNGNPGAQTSAGDGTACVSGGDAADGTSGKAGATGGMPGMSTFAAATPGGGGGGGKTIAGLGGGGTGGGGAGMFYVSAGGDITITGGFTAIGGAGGGGALGGFGGGGGTGGTLLLQSGGTATIDTVTLTGGPGGSPSGQTGTTGAVRIDSITATPIANAYIGPQFKTAPTVVFDPTIASGTSLVLVGIPGDSSSTGSVLDKDSGAIPGGTFNLTFSAAGTTNPSVTLGAGYNRICAILPGGNIVLHPEAGNCVEVAYLPGQH